MSLLLIDGTDSIPEISINRPDALNALSPAVLQDLEQWFSDQEGNSDLRAVIITGAGEKSFVAGADVTEMASMDKSGIEDYIRLGQRVMNLIESFPVPVIAKMNGFALGGGLELALACDVIIASDRAKIGQPEVNLGIIPGFGGTVRLLERCGSGTAKRLIFSGEIIKADEALRLGVVDQVIAPEDLDSAVSTYTELVASKGPIAVRESKRILREYSADLRMQGLDREVSAFLELFGSADRTEGMSAFVEKRSAQFQGK